jgi:hypothetical protein
MSAYPSPFDHTNLTKSTRYNIHMDLLLQILYAPP